MADDRASRRSFLRKLLGGCLFAGLGGTLASVGAYLFPADAVSSALGPRRIKVGRAGDVPLGHGKLTLIEDEPVWVVHLARDFVAMSAWCTHKGCIVKWEVERRLFACPCHQGMFDGRGNVISGLPLRPLRRFRVGVVGGDLYVSRRPPRL
ncbi:MAG: ubiquinol-cytochrome c reductase iron-sulfur subunit [Candidatus Binatia bacterium]